MIVQAIPSIYVEFCHISEVFINELNDRTAKIQPFISHLSSGKFRFL